MSYLVPLAFEPEATAATDQTLGCKGQKNNAVSGALILHSLHPYARFVKMMRR